MVPLHHIQLQYKGEIIYIIEIQPVGLQLTTQTRACFYRQPCKTVFYYYYFFA